jgi:hypothetical protein
MVIKLVANLSQVLNSSIKSVRKGLNLCIRLDRDYYKCVNAFCREIRLFCHWDCSIFDLIIYTQIKIFALGKVRFKRNKFVIEILLRKDFSIIHIPHPHFLHSEIYSNSVNY